MTSSSGRRLTAALAAATTAALVCTACGSSGGNSSGGNASGKSTTKITISYSQQVGDEIPLWIAKDAGYFKQQGLDVSLRYLKSNAGIPALISGQTQIASIGGSDALSAAAQGADLRYVATLAPVYTYQFWAQPQHATAAKLKGQRVGITSTSGSLYAATVVCLGKLGLKPSDVQVVPLGAQPAVDSALLSGSIAAAASHPPSTFQYQKHGLVKLVDLVQQKIPNANTGFAVQNSYLSSHRDVVQGAVTAVVKGLQREKKDKAFAEKMMTKYMGLTGKAVLDYTYNFYANQVTKSVPVPKVEQFQATQKALGATNSKVKSFDLSKFVYPDLVNKAAKDLGLKSGS